MATKRAQERIAKSRYALPVMAVYTTGVWLAGGLVEQQLYAQLATLAICTYLMVELNNSNALLHMYSRMVSCSFLALAGIAFCWLLSLQSSLCMLCLITFLSVIFCTYQDRQSPGLTYYAFLSLGMASTLFIQVLYLVPILWLLMAFNLMAFSWRMLWASLLGILTPYWFLGAAVAYTNKYDLLLQHFGRIAQFEPLFQYHGLTPNEILSFAFVLVLALTGIVHYMRKSYLDSIRTRMIYHVCIMLTAAITLFIVLQPQHFGMLFPMMIVTVSPLIAHFIAHTHKRLTNIAFFAMLIVALLLTAFNLWMPSSSF